MLCTERRRVLDEHRLFRVSDPALPEVCADACLLQRGWDWPRHLELGSAVPESLLRDAVGDAPVHPQQDRQQPMVSGYRRLGVQVPQGTPASVPQDQSVYRGYAVQFTGSGPVPDAGHAGEYAAWTVRGSLPMPVPHVSAVLFVLVRVQVG